MELNDLLKDVWPEWKIEAVLGRGSYGYVYKAVKNYHNIETRSAIKVISIPQTESEIEEFSCEGMTLEQTRTYYQEVVDEIVNEIVMMESLKSVNNVVKIEDYKVCERDNAFGWDIYIRMELLTPLNSFLCDRKLSEKEVMKLGMDICSALEICNIKNIIHRDIKPENIFVNEFGDFKLGDFGIARKLENLTFGLSQKGTFNYMAPEMATSSFYDKTVDIYSLGIVLYKLLNSNRLPFLDASKQLLSPFERKHAVEMRLKGDELTPPLEASPEAAAVILKASAYLPESRYQDAKDMKRALMAVWGKDNPKEDMTALNNESVAIAGILKKESSADLTASESKKDDKKASLKVKKRKVNVLELVLTIICIALGLCILVFVVYIFRPNAFTKPMKTIGLNIGNEVESKAESVAETSWGSEANMEWKFSFEDSETHEMIYELADISYPKGYYSSDAYKKCEEAYNKAVKLTESGEREEAGEYLSIFVNDPYFLISNYGSPSLTVDVDQHDNTGYYCGPNQAYKTIHYWDTTIPRAELTLYYLTEESEEPEYLMFWHDNEDGTLVYSSVYAMDGTWKPLWSDIETY